MRPWAMQNQNGRKTRAVLSTHVELRLHRDEVVRPSRNHRHCRPLPVENHVSFHPMHHGSVDSEAPLSACARPRPSVRGRNGLNIRTTALLPLATVASMPLFLRLPGWGRSSAVASSWRLAAAPHAARANERQGQQSPLARILAPDMCACRYLTHPTSCKRLFAPSLAVGALRLQALPPRSTVDSTYFFIACMTAVKRGAQTAPQILVQTLAMR